MLFPISGIEVNPFIPFVVAFVVSFITSMGGVSGAFLLLPFQVSMLGYTAPSVSATNPNLSMIISMSRGILLSPFAAMPMKPARCFQEKLKWFT